jgi:vancomycin resistance protein YoaR
VINFYENVAGWDATVYAPYTDFKWRNDTAGPIWIYTTTNPAKATVTFTIYGYPDGRTTKMVGPAVTNVVQPGKANWQYDPNLKRGQTTQLVHGRPGMDVAMRRVVTAANGTVLHNDNLPSKYKAWEDFFLYGPGVTPPKGVNVIPATTRAANPKP